MLWFDKDLGHLELVQRVSFSPLTRQYRFSRGGLSQTYDTLEQILPITRHLIGLANRRSLQCLMILRWNWKCVCGWIPHACPNPCKSSSGGNSDWALDSDWITIDIKQALEAKLFPDPSRL